MSLTAVIRDILVLSDWTAVCVCFNGQQAELYSLKKIPGGQPNEQELQGGHVKTGSTEQRSQAQTNEENALDLESNVNGKRLLILLENITKEKQELIKKHEFERSVMKQTVTNLQRELLKERHACSSKTQALENQLKSISNSHSKKVMEVSRERDYYRQAVQKCEQDINDSRKDETTKVVLIDA